MWVGLGHQMWTDVHLCGDIRPTERRDKLENVPRPPCLRAAYLRNGKLGNMPFVCVSDLASFKEL